MNTNHQRVKSGESNWGGSCLRRGDLAAGAATRRGATPLEALLVGDCASYGVACFLTDARQAGQLVQRNGRHPHPRSVARARRSARAKRLLNYERVMPHHRPPTAKHRSAFGTTSKLVDFRALGIRDPLTRGERRRIGRRLEAIEREHDPEHAERVAAARFYGEGRARHSAVPTMPAPAMDPELQRTINEFGEVLERRWTRDEQRADDAMQRSILRGRAPP